MNPMLMNSLNQAAIIAMELFIGFGLFWLGQFAYQKVFRPMDLNLQLFVRDNPAVATALVGYYLGIVLALGGVLGKSFTNWEDQIGILASYGVLVILLMLAGGWIGDRLILRCFDCARETLEERNTGAAAAEAGNHIANGLILNAALGGESGTWIVGVVCWVIGLAVLYLASLLYPIVARYDVFGEIQRRNNPAAGVALGGLLVAIGNLVRIAFSPEFQGWWVSLSQYGLTLAVCLLAMALIRWLADVVLVPGVRISDEIVNQEIPNLGAGMIEAFAYIASSILIEWVI